MNRSVDGVAKILDELIAIRDMLHIFGPLSIPQIVTKVMSKDRGHEEKRIRATIQNMIEEGDITLERDMRVALNVLHTADAWPPGSLMSYTSEAFHDCGVVVGNFDNKIVVLWATGAESLKVYDVYRLNLHVVDRVQRYSESG